MSRETGKAETVTEREVKEARDFLDACMDTRPMQYVFKYCQEKVLHLKHTHMSLKAPVVPTGFRCFCWVSVSYVQ